MTFTAVNDLDQPLQLLGDQNCLESTVAFKEIDISTDIRGFGSYKYTFHPNFHQLSVKVVGTIDGNSLAAFQTHSREYDRFSLCVSSFIYLCFLIIFSCLRDPQKLHSRDLPLSSRSNANTTR